MQREELVPRIDWPRKVEELGFHFHTIDGVYWDERACYEFTATEIDTPLPGSTFTSTAPASRKRARHAAASVFPNSRSSAATLGRSHFSRPVSSRLVDTSTDATFSGTNRRHARSYSAICPAYFIGSAALSRSVL